MIPPSPTGFTVYTKTGCKFCSLVKELLEDESPLLIDATPYLEEDKEAFLAAMNTGDHKTFPMVFKDGTFIGGFKETYALIKSSVF
jgi:glutaredoxin